MPYTARYGTSRSFSLPGLPPGVKWLLIVNTALFVVSFFSVHAGVESFLGPLSLWPRAVVTVPALWQLFTYMFLHDPFGFAHILFNMLALWMFGADLERDWGTRRFLEYYFLCGVGAGVTAVGANLLFGNPDARTIGASGAIYGLLLAFGVLYPDRIVLMSFLFPIKAKYFVMIMGAIAFMSSMGASGGGISHVAHLGGMIFGLLFLKRRKHRLVITTSSGGWYEQWKRNRARKKFDVYLRDHDSKRGPWVN